MSRPLLTVRCTVVEGFRQWMSLSETEAEDKPWFNEADIISKIKGIESSNIKADYGTAGHSIIENPFGYKTSTGYQVKKFTFTDSQAKPMLDFRTEHPLMTRECAASKIYSTKHFDLVITGTIDHLEGVHMRDTKFKFSSFDPADFMNSAQWRIYADMVELDTFWYDFFRVNGFNGIEDCGKARISPCESMMLRVHPGMQDDIQNHLNDFADFVVFRNLQEYLEITPAKQKRILNGNQSLKKYLI